MDFEKINADKNMILNRHFTAGRGGHKIEFIGIHYNAANLTIEGCYSVWQNREASAHYQVEDGGRVGQLVWDRDTAWALGNFNANQRSISIEHANRPDGTISEACLDNGAHLVAALCKMYGLGRPQWGVNVKPHCAIVPTSCPGQIYGSQKDAYIQRAQMWYDNMTGSAPAPSPTPAPSPAPAPAPAPKPNGAEHSGTGFGGVYRCTVAALNVRTAPTVNSGTVATYKQGMTVTLDDWYKIADGYVWGRYTGGSGNKRYVAVGKATGKPEAGDFLVKVGVHSPAPAPKPSTTEHNAAGFGGVYRCTVAALNVRTAPTVNSATVATYKKGMTVTLDDWYKSADGYIWGRYTGGSGKKRYVAVGKATGKPEAGDFLVKL